MRKLFLGLALAAVSTAPAMASFVPPFATSPFVGGFFGQPPVTGPGQIAPPIAYAPPRFGSRPVAPPVTQPTPGVKRPLPAPVPPRNVIVIPDCRVGPC